MDTVGFVVNNVVRALICEPCKWALAPHMAQGHMDETHSEANVTIDKKRFREALESLEVSDKLPTPPAVGVYPEVVGLAISQGLSCKHCDKALGTKRSMGEHHREHHVGVPMPKSWESCDLQQYHPHHAKTMFQILRRGSGKATWVDDMIQDIRESMSKVTQVTPQERNARAISPWLLATKWDKHIAGFPVEELRSLIATPKEREFPGLIRCVRDYFERATDLIDHTDELVLQRLNSPDPTKE